MTLSPTHDLTPTPTCEIPIPLWVALVLWASAEQDSMAAPDLRSQVSAACKASDAKRDLLVTLRDWENSILAKALKEGLPR